MTVPNLNLGLGSVSYEQWLQPVTYWLSCLRCVFLFLIIVERVNKLELELELEHELLWPLHTPVKSQLLMSNSSLTMSHTELVCESSVTTTCTLQNILDILTCCLLLSHCNIVTFDWKLMISHQADKWSKHRRKVQGKNPESQFDFV